MIRLKTSIPTDKIPEIKACLNILAEFEVVELTTTLKPFFTIEPYAAPSLVANSGVNIYINNPRSTVFAKNSLRILDPQIIFLSTTAKGSTVFEGHILTLGFIITLSFTIQLSPTTAFSYTWT